MRLNIFFPINIRRVEYINKNLGQTSLNELDMNLEQNRMETEFNQRTLPLNSKLGT